MDLYGLSPAAIAAAAEISVQTATRWKRDGIPARYRSLVALQLNGDLSVVHVAWAGWKLWRGLLWSPEGESFTAGEVRAIPYRSQLVSELQHKLREPHQYALLPEAITAPAIDPVTAIASRMSKTRTSTRRLED